MEKIETSDLKLIIKFEYLSKNRIKLSLVHVKENILYDSTKGIGYNYSSNNNRIFNIWSSGSLLFDCTQLRLPSSINMKPNVSSICEFFNEDTTKSTLKNLYTTLTIWSNSISKENLKNRVIVENEYWYVK